MRPLDFLSMAAVAGLLSWCAFDLFSRASDPYRISYRKSPAATRPDGIVPFAAPGTLSAFPARAGHHVAPTPVADLSEQGPFGIKSSRDMEVPYGPVTAYATQLPQLATSHSAFATQKEVIPPVPAGRTKPLSPAKHLVQKARATTLTRAQLAAEVRAALPKLPKAEVDAAVWIIWRESGGRTTAKNPRSSSHGLNGFISRSWVSMTKRHGIKHSLAPRAQILALYHYCNDRYGSMSAARSFHRKRGWY